MALLYVSLERGLVALGRFLALVFAEQVLLLLKNRKELVAALKSVLLGYLQGKSS